MTKGQTGRSCCPYNRKISVSHLVSASAYLPFSRGAFNLFWFAEDSAKNDTTIAASQSLDVSTRRGGTLVHKPVKDNHLFSAFVQPLVTSWRSSPPLQPQPNGVSPQAAWIQHMIHLHSRSEGAGVGASAGTGKRKRAASRGVSGVTKRKRVEEELVWSLENMLEQNRKQQQEAARRRKKKAAKRGSDVRVTGGEDDASALEYLGKCHEGNVEAAKFMVMANLSGGEGKLPDGSEGLCDFTRPLILVLATHSCEDEEM